jgi:hypothetical protein
LFLPPSTETTGQVNHVSNSLDDVQLKFAAEWKKFEKNPDIKPNQSISDTFFSTNYKGSVLTDLSLWNKRITEIKGAHGKSVLESQFNAERIANNKLYLS